MATTRHRSLVEWGGIKAFVSDKSLAHTQTEKGKCQEKSEIHDSKENDSSTKSFQQSY